MTKKRQRLLDVGRDVIVVVRFDVVLALVAAACVVAALGCAFAWASDPGSVGAHIGGIFLASGAFVGFLAGAFEAMRRAGF